MNFLKLYSSHLIAGSGQECILSELESATTAPVVPAILNTVAIKDKVRSRLGLIQMDPYLNLKQNKY